MSLPKWSSLLFALTLSAADMRPRLIVLTDISSLTAGVREPDDGQSLIRLLLFSNDIHLEGLIASSNMGHGQVVRPELIHQAIDAYAEVYPNLQRHDKLHPQPEYLHSIVKAGQPIAGPGIPPENSLTGDTEASRFLRARIIAADRRPLWIAIWGGSADLAQALNGLRDHPSLNKVRVHAIGDQDSTGPWIKAQFPSLFYITRSFAIRGMYRGGDTALVSPDWVETNIRNGHGPLGALYPNYDGGDIWWRRLARPLHRRSGPAHVRRLPLARSIPERIRRPARLVCPSTPRGQSCACRSRAPPLWPNRRLFLKRSRWPCAHLPLVRWCDDCAPFRLSGSAGADGNR
jgi:hypothetical protein